MGNLILLIIVAATMFAMIGGLTLASHLYNLNGIKSKTVGDGQHGTARFASKGELRRTYKFVPFEPKAWRAAKGKDLHLPQGVVVGCQNKHGQTVALVDTGDVHTMMIGAAGCGKTAFWLYPNLEYACAAGMSFLTTDTKGDLYRNYGNMAKEQYGYSVAVIDLRNPTKSDGNNLLHLVNKYMDLSKEHPDNLAYRAKAEKYAKIIAKTLIYNDGDASAYLYLRDRCDKDRKAWPGIKRMAADLSLSRSTVKRAIRDLEKGGLIRKEPRYRENGSATSNRYYLL